LKFALISRLTLAGPPCIRALHSSTFQSSARPGGNPCRAFAWVVWLEQREQGCVVHEAADKHDRDGGSARPFVGPIVGRKN
jgi:hypothetical protein